MAVAFSMMLVLHVMSTLLPERIRRVTLPINIALHAILVVPALFFVDPEGTPIELDAVALVYMISLAVYTVCYFISDFIEKRRERAANSAGAEKEAEDDL